MSVLVVGLSHRSAPVSVLERASLAPDARAKLLADAVAAAPVTEAAVLATCNRIELYAAVDKFHAGVAELSTLLAQHAGASLEELTPHLYVHYENRAVHHLFTVGCGLDSMVVGEGQILGQIKESLALGQRVHAVGRTLNDLFQQALRVGKRAHSETGIDRAGQSLVSFGLTQLAAGAPVAEWVAGRRALVIGAGSMSSLAATTLARAGAAELVIANRTYERAERLAASLNAGSAVTGGWSPAGSPAAVAAGSAVAAGAIPAQVQSDGAAAGGPVARAARVEEIPDELVTADLVVSCTGATGLVLTADDVATALHRRAKGASGGAGAPDSGAGAPSRAKAGGEELRGTRGRRTGDAGGGAGGAAAAAAGGGLALLDLAMPRDIDHALHDTPGVRFVDIETLAGASADAPMAADVDRVRAIVAEEVDAFGAAQRAAGITPTVVALRTMAQDVVAGEIARLEGRLPGLDERQRAEVAQTVRRVVDKLLHAPTVRVKELAATPDGAGYADALRELFDLDPATVDAVSRADSGRAAASARSEREPS
ncbi:glutamyl-tRNA reductase [Streptomyces sp. WMMC500]|uniref:glutamyl-tRNA reductase n=1 Tax=Streptomyces sp. WMMC500 TaxID=3015154 RepID=UPI00248D0691|nr:glutamyl-tRNA reductase [Streptomyces sp. WMMC500]WBB63953.1 glutamyl-tRNA reductase [Streptomyces sp. WMMC500]